MDLLPFIIITYLVFLIFIRPTKAASIASLLGGLTMAIINILGDWLAYFVHVWHYTFTGQILHLPLPFYATPLFITGGLAYLLIWRFWLGRLHWLALSLLVGVPVLGVLRDLFLALSGSGYLIWDSPWAIALDLLLWPVMFYAGFQVFRRFAPARMGDPAPVRA